MFAPQTDWVRSLSTAHGSTQGALSHTGPGHPCAAALTKKCILCEIMGPRDSLHKKMKVAVESNCMEQHKQQTKSATRPAPSQRACGRKQPRRQWGLPGGINAPVPVRAAKRRLTVHVPWGRRGHACATPIRLVKITRKML